MPRYKCVVCGDYCKVSPFTFKEAEPPICSPVCLYEYITKYKHKNPFDTISYVSISRIADPSYRSTWEFLFARWLKKRQIEFKYECAALKLNEYDYYIPDFYIPSTCLFIEIKGRLDQRGKHKIREALKLPNISLLYLNKKALKGFKII